MTTLRSRALAPLLALLATAAPAPVLAEPATSDFRFWDAPGQDGWVDPEVAWRPDDPYWDRRERDDWILDGPGRRWPYPQPEPTTRGKLEAVVSGVTAQVYQDRGRAALQVDVRRVIRAGQDEVVRRGDGLRRDRFGQQQVTFMVLVPLSQPIFFTSNSGGGRRDDGRHGSGTGDGWRHGGGGTSTGGTEYLVAVVQGTKDQIYYALPVQTYDGGGYQSGTGDGTRHENSIWYPGPDRRPEQHWTYDLAVVGVGRAQGGDQVEVVVGMDWTRARESQGYLDVGSLPRLSRDPPRDRRHGGYYGGVLGWTQDATGGWLRKFTLQRGAQGRGRYGSDRVAGVTLKDGGGSRSVDFWRQVDGDGESVSAAGLVDGFRLREDGWAVDEDRGHGQWQRPQPAGTFYWGLVWEWDRGQGHRRDEPVYRPLEQGGPDWDGLR